MTTVLARHTAPWFTLPGMDGARHSLADALKKGPVVVAFFKISCPVCQFTFPFLERLYRTCGSGSVTFWGISQDDARDTRDFNKEYGVTLPSLIDEKGYPVSNDYGLSMVPTILLIAPDGQVKVSSMGFSRQDLEEIAAELAGHTKKAPTPLFKPGEIVPDSKPG